MRHRMVGIAVSALLAFAASAAIASSASAITHAVNTCQSASFYANYDSASGPSGFLRTLGPGDKIGHDLGTHPVYNGWAAAFDYGPNDWGYMRIECIGGLNSW